MSTSRPIGDYVGCPPIRKPEPERTPPLAPQPVPANEQQAIDTGLTGEPGR
jgi:hypothetical protein